MKCVKCGAEISNDAKFCTSCGEPVEVAKAVEEVKEEAAEQVSEVKEEVTEQLSEVKEEAAEKVAEVKEEAAEKVAEVKEEAAEKVAEVKEEVAEKVAEVKEEAAEKVAEIKEEVAEKAAEVKETLSDATEAIQEKTKKVSKTAWIVLAAVAVVLLLVLCNFSVVANTVSKLVMSPEKYYAHVEKKEMKQLVADLASAYDNTIMSHSDVTNQSMTYNMQLELSETAYKMLESALNIEDGKSLSKMGIDVMASVKGDSISAEVAAKLGKSQLISANMVADLEKGEAYGQIPELTDKYIGVNFSEYAEVAKEGMAKSAEMFELLPKKALLEKLLNRYIAIALENVDSVTEKSDKISVGEIEQKCTSIRVRLKAEDAVDILAAVCEEAKDDKELINLVAAFVVSSGYMEEAEAKEAIADAIASVLDNIDSMKENVDEEAEVVMYVWVNNKGEVIGREIKLGDDEFVISYQMPQKGKKFAFEAVIGEDEEDVIELKGEGKKSDTSLSGEFKLEVEGAKLLEITVDKMNTKKTMQGLPNGKFTLKLGKSLYSEMGSAAAMFSGYEMDVELESSKSDASISIALMKDDDMFAKISMDTKTGSGKSASLPKKGILVEDEDDIAEWAESIDVNKFIKKLSKTDLPDEFVEVLEGYSDDLEDMIDDL